MLLGDHFTVDEKEEQSNKGDASLKSPQENLSASDPNSRANTISTQPVSTSQHAAGPMRPQRGPPKPTCPRCGLTAADRTLPPPPRSQGRLQGSSSSVHSRHTTAAAPCDSCFHLLLACLWCRCSALLLGLLEACDTCARALCSSCCRACARCCSAVREAPVEELNCHAHCHSVLFESCCEPTECLELCVELCQLCHRS